MWTLFTAYLKREPRLPFFMAYSNYSKAAAILVMAAYLTRSYRPASKVIGHCLPSARALPFFKSFRTSQGMIGVLGYLSTVVVCRQSQCSRPLNWNCVT